MGRSRKPRVKRTDSESDEGDPSISVVFLSSSDDEEANRDFSSEIVQRARELELKRKWEGIGVIPISSTSSEDFEMKIDRKEIDETTDFAYGAVEERKIRSKSKGKKKKKKELVEEPAAAVDAPANEEELVGTGDSVVTEVNEISDNAVLRKLLRGPRYFDPGDRNSEACFNCGEEGHIAANCTMERRKRPCFVCGMFGHNAKSCIKGQDCYICKRRGHIARNCPDKHNHSSKDSLVCLRCGELGHEMLSCENDYAPEDLKEIQCYVCKNYGHLCCVDFADDGPRMVSCYNCAQSGHSGLGCAKPRGEINDQASPTLCYKCGEEGHFARGCTKYSKSKARHLKFDRWEGGGSSPRGFGSESRDSLGFRSAPHDTDRVNRRKKEKLQNEDRWDMTASKPRARGGWIVDDPGDLPRRKQHRSNKWKSPSTPRSSEQQYSASPFKKRTPFVGTPNCYASTSGHYHGHSAARYGKSHDYFERSY